MVMLMLALLAACSPIDDDSNPRPATEPGPIALGGCSVTTQEHPLLGQLQVADVNQEPLSLTYRIVSVPSKGEVVLLDPGTGQFRYTPHRPSPRGEDSFEFEISDGNGRTTSATQTIIVHPKIMPLGDSITSGYIAGVPVSEQVSYRKRLYELLVTAGFHFDFVGSLQHGATTFPEDPDHEGHGGATDGDLAAGVYGWLERNPTDFVLLHIGTNGLHASSANVELLLNEIDRWEQDAANGNTLTVLLARIIDQNPSNPLVQEYNDAVQTMAVARAEDRIIIVDQQNTLYRDGEPVAALYDDRLHPTQAGYDAMAEAWFEVLREHLPKCRGTE